MGAVKNAAMELCELLGVNMDLILAAPDLLDVCESIVLIQEKYGTVQPAIGASRMQDLVDFVAKAKGHQS